MKKGVALLVAAGLLAGMAVPVSGAEQIVTHKGEKELVLEEAGDVDLTKEELIEKSKSTMEDADDLTLFMNMDLEANMSYEAEGTSMSADLIMKMEMTDNKNGDMEYNLSKNTMSFLGMSMEETSEEYVFPNAAGKKVSVKKESSTETEDESEGTWVAEAVEEESEAAAEAESLEGELEESASVDTVLSDDMFQLFELLDKMYTDGEKNYYVLKAKSSDVVGTAFADFEEMFGEMEVDGDCYMLIAEDGTLESLDMDLDSLVGQTMEQEGVKYSFSAFQMSAYTDVSEEIVIPEEVKAAGDAAA